MLFWGTLIYTMAVRCGIWEKGNILILRSIVCEMPFCCPKRVTVSLIRSDFLGVEGSRCRMKLLSGGERWRVWGYNSDARKEGSFRREKHGPLGSHSPHRVLSASQKCLNSQPCAWVHGLAQGKPVPHFPHREFLWGLKQLKFLGRGVLNEGSIVRHTETCWGAVMRSITHTAHSWQVSRGN